MFFDRIRNFYVSAGDREFHICSPGKDIGTVSRVRANLAKPGLLAE